MKPKLRLSDIYHNLVTSGLELNYEELNYKRVRIINFILYLSVIINAALIKPNINDGQIIYPIASSVVVLVGSIAILLLRQGIHRIRLVSHISLFVIYIILFPALFEGGIANSGFVWYFLLPLFAIFLLGKNQGLFWIYLMFTTEAAAWLLLDPANLPYRKEFLIYHMLSLAVGTLFIMLMQSVTDGFQNSMKQQNDKLQTMAITDALTQLFNRRHIDSQIISEMNQAKQTQHGLSLILFDIDNFKDINDTYGHNVGDMVLIETAKLLKNSVRKEDFVGRWGGEEFLILCNQCSVDNAIVLANKVRQALAQHDFGLKEKVTASFGVVEMTESHCPNSLLKDVDHALYQAKEQGKNTVVCFSSLSAI